MKTSKKKKKSYKFIVVQYFHIYILNISTKNIFLLNLEFLQGQSYKFSHTIAIFPTKIANSPNYDF